MAFELVDDRKATNQASLAFIKVFESTDYELLGDMMGKCWLIPLHKFAS